MLCAFTYSGELAVAGLSWEQTPERLSHRQIGVRWDTSFAPVDEPAFLGHPSLLSLILSRVPAEHCADELIIAYADPQYTLFFGALVSEGAPLNFPERVFKDLPSLAKWVEEEVRVGGSQAVATNEIVAQSLPDDIRKIALLDPIENFKEFPRDTESNVGSKSRSTEGRDREFELIETWKRYNAICVSGQPRSFDVANKKVRLFGALGFSALIAVGCALYYVNAASNQEPEVAVPTAKTIFVGRDEAAYLSACGAAFLKPWSIAPGWRRDTSGCSGPNMAAPAGVQTAAPLAYQTYQLDAGANPTIARAAAKLVLDQSGDVISGSDTKLIVTRALSYAAPNSAAGSDAAPNTQDPDAEFERIWEQPQTHPDPEERLRAVEVAFLGRARSVEVVGGNAEITAIIGAEIEVSMWGSPRDVIQILLSSASLLDWAYLTRLEERDGLVTARIGARALKPRVVPIDPQEGEAQP
jgi:hypothetical protein